MTRAKSYHRAFTPLHPKSSSLQAGDEWPIKFKISKKPRPKGWGVTGFTLVEVLISVVIIALVSITSYMGFFVLTGASDSSHNRLNAVTLSQAALEEVRGTARDRFENLENIVFTDINQDQFPGFHRTITVTAQNTRIKKADVSITWQDRGNKPRQFNNSALISLPREPFPANVWGKVTSSENGASVPSATLCLEYVDNASLTVITTSNSEGNFTFVDANGNFALTPGSWKLTATCDGFFSSEVIDVPDLVSEEDREVNVVLTPAGPGRIIGRFILDDGTPVFNLEAQLYENGQQLFYKITNGAGGFDFSPIVFTVTGQRCFTANSIYAFRDYVSTSYCGYFCDPNGWGKDYNYHGWSSAVVRGDGSAVCANPWNGNAATDRICLSAGETVDLGNIELARSPKATLTGYVRDGAGNPIGGATVAVRLYDYNFGVSTSTDSAGHYTITVIAHQELFPDLAAYYMQVRVAKTLTGPSCCGVLSTTTFATQAGVGPAFAGATINRDFVLICGFDTCGNVHGRVSNALTTAPLSGAQVTVTGAAGGSVKTTDSSGNYQFECADGGFCIPAGTPPASIQMASGYYNFTSASNKFYQYRGCFITANIDTEYNVALLPLRTGSIAGRVIDNNMGTAIVNATVALDYYADGASDLATDVTIQTDSEGKFEFNPARESWPPPEIAGSGTIYRLTPVRNHKITVSKSGYTYWDNNNTTFTLMADQSLDFGDIRLSSGSGM